MRYRCKGVDVPRLRRVWDLCLRVWGSPGGHREHDGGWFLIAPRSLRQVVSAYLFPFAANTSLPASPCFFCSCFKHLCACACAWAKHPGIMLSRVFFFQTLPDNVLFYEAMRIRTPLMAGRLLSCWIPSVSEWHDIIASLFSLSFSILTLFFVHLAFHNTFISDIRGVITVYYSLDGK